MLIAGTALAHNLAVATRNDWDLEGANMEVAIPWNST